MKKQFILLFSILLSFGIASISLAQPPKLKKKDLKAMKEARKQGKKMKKDGWNVAPGALPIEKSLERSWSMLLDYDEEGKKKYLDADGNAVAESKSAADLQALELAKLNLAGQIETQVAALIEASVANQQLTREEAASVTKVVAGSKNMIKNVINEVDPVYKVYREVGRKNIEVQLKIFYDRENAMNGAKKVIRNKLEEETNIIHEKLDNILDLK
ncbi:hypothetical protein [Chondrinema litorale]|uniref:hypothetical protein n=1 Tax=Chondrinema litorale TaxID=2994555 RepID=UPI002542E14C|nr:hypothetical protein [Chondrinema litorale]UZR95121.1 hypothetical protein OQ292_04730 [Chondrinema litorale]